MTTTSIDGALAAALRSRNFRPSRPRPDRVWIRGRRSSSRRVIAILEPDGSLTMHRQSPRRLYTARVVDTNDVTTEAIEYALLTVLRS